MIKFSLSPSFQEHSASESLSILVAAEHVAQATAAYQIKDLDSIIQATQFKAGFNESLSLLASVAECTNSNLIGLGKTEELPAAKLAKIAQSIIKSSQKKFKQISIDLSALPRELHYVFALSSTQAAYAFDEYKSKKNEFQLEQINLIAKESSLTADQLQLIEAMQSGQNMARDLS